MNQQSTLQTLALLAAFLAAAAVFIAGAIATFLVVQQMIMGSPLLPALVSSAMAPFAAAGAGLAGATIAGTAIARTADTIGKKPFPWVFGATMGLSIVMSVMASELLVGLNWLGKALVIGGCALMIFVGEVLANRKLLLLKVLGWLFLLIPPAAIAAGIITGPNFPLETAVANVGPLVWLLFGLMAATSIAGGVVAHIYDQ